ncbi:MULTISPECIES: ABC transporter permease [Bradyrhizobium]|jgi:ABC-type dipeptide/oligopeptide/nickel transport system permease subunit|uniref:ABC transporter permease n=1 Tax=Bradyrhizobium TaxID=374 RepID=UPI0004B0EF95|nr:MULTISPECIES: ABC transporter permease [Bradyrhizobium]MCS3451264.1 peptide/nickel transport system permease protein [Bradyrhizobium elkanii]MCS3566712.1 peptide/nickel transport system permease protein [Bradyrhizobium elkanii]MCW2152562.1 peptide/nickel transport system permease protein [Bradyrhizobium elkanii]MCW2357560.1 peptide/nickel transport system permease protein [Bradyrhizobium elkanii]MCW2376294.1 peptide/nickel transport system permease protein [Bradyrhizobium elkanii]
MTAPSHRSFEQAVALERPEDVVGFETLPATPVVGIRRRPPLGFVVALAFVALLIIAAAVPSLFTHFDPLVGDFTEGLKPPGWAHLFGTDRLGRDVFARTVYGTRYSLLIGFGGVAVGLGFGVVLGIIAGQRNRILDEAVSRLFDMLSSFPGVLLAMLIVTFLGQGMLNIAIAVGIAGIPKFGRVVRAQTQLVRDADYVTQAAIYGLSRWQVFVRHVLPNVLVAIPIIATVYVGSTILIVSGLSFLGLGPQPPTPEWGVMLAESRDVLRVAWWPGVFPGLAITATVIAFSIVGNFLQKTFEGRVA